MPRGRPKKKKEINIKSKETRAFFGFLLTFLGVALFMTNTFDNTLAHTVVMFFGQGLYLIAIISTVWGLRLIGLDVFFTTKRFIWGLLVLLVTATTFFQTFAPLAPIADEQLTNNGGRLGYAIHDYLYHLVGPAGEYGILLLFLLLSLSLLSGLSMEQLAELVKNILSFFMSIFEKIFHTAKDKLPEPDIIMSQRGQDEEKSTPKAKEKEAKPEEPDIMHTELDELGGEEEVKAETESEEDTAESEDEESPDRIQLNFGKDLQSKNDKGKDNKELFDDTATEKFPNWQLPPVNLLDPAEKDSIDQENLKDHSKIIDDTLASFKIQAKVKTIFVGPSVVQYAINLAVGTKLSKVQTLAKDIGLALAAPSDSVRIDSIGGTSLVGIEVPRQKPKMVHAREVVEEPTMDPSGKKKVPLAIGQDVNGNYVVEDLSDMPHLLIAGATGTGKSVTLNSIILGFLMKFSPDELKMILVDPKMVELTLYNNIPHLLTPVVTEKEKVINALDWAIFKMTERYKIFQKEKVRKITEYNELGKGKMPYIIVIVDEMADLMLLAKADIEQKIVRLAQLARATGIHLILATQRPSVNVITGLIKANIPARVALGVSSGVDSRVIIDQQGAETLLGKGDMLVKTPNSAKLRRVQGAFVSNDEITKVTNFLKSQLDEDISEIYEEDVVSGAPGSSSGGGDASAFSDDPMFREAVGIVIESGKASASSLQRYLKVGFNRAARLIDQMEEAGIVSPPNGSKPRDVLVGSMDEVFDDS